MVAPVKLLVIVPHPDDEVFGSGGTLLDFLSHDEPCALLTLTLGDAGRNLGLCETREELAALRRQELADCLDTLGFLRHPASAHEQYTFPDGDVAGHLSDITPLIHDAFETYQPEIVLTFPPDGLNGHPDHVTTHQVVKAVWDALPPERRPRLWYYALQAEWLGTLLPGYLPPNRVHDVSAFVTQKLRAMGCHRSQGITLANTLRRFPERVTHEPFHEVLPDPRSG
ncbi:PIG-L deacetylase family protein [Deinococcus frigens]|nr:PIG-L deacetylase family protein [Deinococcus frigens]